MVEQFKVPWMANAELRQNRLKQMREVGTEAPYERAYFPLTSSLYVLQHDIFDNVVPVSRKLTQAFRGPVLCIEN